MRKVLLVAGLAVAGCASSWHEVVRGPSGGVAYSIGCRRGITNCYREAGQLCPMGYTIVNQTGGHLNIVSTTNGPIVSRGPDNLFIECRPASAGR